MVLRCDPVPWLMAQEGLPAVRARRALGLAREADDAAAAAVARKLADEQLPDGSFAGSPMRTAGVLCLLADLRVPGACGVATAAAAACTLHAMRALGAHPQLRSSGYAERAAGFLQRSRPQSRPFAVLHAVAGTDTRAAHEVARTALEAALPRQRKDGAFGGPCHVERVRAVLTAVRALGGAACCTMP